ncbi:MAG TPA: META domain-containing protein [Solirubrobacterales bacterium]|jgi:hypothetical protein
MGWLGSLVGIGATVAAALVFCAGSVAAPPTKVLFERSYRAVSVTVRAGSDPFEDDQRIKVWFDRGLEPTGAYRYSVGWVVRCNRFGGDMKIGPHRLWVKPNFQTEQGCSTAAERENEWMLAFFDAGPGWEAGPRGTLILTSKSATLTLARIVTTM